MTMTSTITRTSTKGRGYLGRWGILAACAATLLAALTGCAVRGSFVRAQAGEGGDIRVTLAEPGLSRIMARLPKDAAPWKSVVLRNNGPVPVRDIRFWDLGGADLIWSTRQPAPGEDPDEKKKPAFEPFALLPDEQLALNAEDTTRGQSRLNGLFLWESPKEPLRLRACLQRGRGARVSERGIVFTPTGGSAYLEMEFSSPAPIASARLAWTVGPTTGTQEAAALPRPQVWVNVGTGVWARVVQGRQAVDWLDPLDLTASVAGHRSFKLRLSFEPGAVDPDELTSTLEVPLPAEILLSRLRMEREIQEPGALQSWRPGVNEVSVRFAAPRPASLDVSLFH